MTNSTDEWLGRVVFLTGASSGIGRALALELGRHGAHIALAARRRERLDEVAEEVETLGGEAFVLSLDVTDAAAVESAVTETKNRLGPVETVIANAGIAPRTDVTNIDLEATRYVFDVNVHGALATLKPAIPDMIDRGTGHLVVVSSLAAFHGLPGEAAYCASKAAITRFCDTLRVELKPSGITVTTIHPGYVSTEMNEDRDPDEMSFVVQASDAARKIRGALEARKPRYAFPLPMALLSRASRFIPFSISDRIAGNFGAPEDRSTSVDSYDDS